MSTNIEQIRQDAIEKKKGKALEAVRNRKRKLSELYMVSNLAKIRTVTDNASLQQVKDSLNSFLEANDIQKGHSFDINTLIVDTPTPPVAQSSTEASKEEVKEQPVEPEQLPKDSTKSLNTEEHQQQQQQQQQQLQQQLQQQSQDQIQQRQQVEQPALPPLPRKPIEKRKKTPDSHLSLYDPDNKEAIETNIVLLKEFLPAKVAEATSLAELYYLAQTLPLVKLVPSTHKVVTSTMYETALTEGKINVVHSRIEELKRQGKWSLRQPSKFQDPLRANTTTYWDNLLSEMKWMALDFKEERKLKIATCAFIAESISDYWKYGKVVCIKRRPINFLPEEINIDNVLTVEAFEDSPNDNEEKIDAIDTEKLLARPNPEDEIVAPQLPEITYEDYLKIKGEKPSPFKTLIDTNNMDQGNKTLLESIPTLSAFQLTEDPFASAPIVTVSKSLVPVEDESWFHVHMKQLTDDSDVVVDQQKGLFGFSSQKKISTSTKPPPPPSLKYLDLRTPTIWLPEDDQDLIEFVNQFSFNWGVVSAHLSKRPTRSYSSNIERRTPWQCFERYIQLNDTFQINDMRGQNTISAMKWLEHAHNIQATTKRRISPLGVGVDSIQRGHKRLRWASMFEAVRKCMRKRESITKPNPTQVRRTDETSSLAPPTPSELSKLKYERDKAIQDSYLQNPANGFRTRPQNSQAGPGGKGLPNQQQSALAQAQTKAQAQAQAQVQAQVQQQTRQVPQSQGQGQIPVQAQVQAPIAQVNANQGQQAYQSAASNIKRPVSAVSVPNNVPRSNSGQFTQGGNIPSPNATINPATGAPYTEEQIQQLLQLRQRKLMQNRAAAAAAASANGQGYPSPNNPKAQLVANGVSPAKGHITPRANSNPIAIPQQGTPVMQQSSLNQQQQVGQSSSSGSDDSRKTAFVPAHVSAIINRIQSQNPNMSKQDVTKIAAQYLANLQAKQSRANNPNLNNAGNQGSGVSPSPQLRQVNTGTPPPSRGVPTPQQILLQQQQQQQQQQQKLGLQRTQSEQNIPKPNARASLSPNLQTIQTVNNIQSSPALTPQQKSQLDMLKSLQAEQVQKRQQGLSSQSGSNLSSPSGGANTAQPKKP